MAKQSLVEAAKNLGRQKSGRSFEDRLSPDELKEYRELIEWAKRLPPNDKPSGRSLHNLICKRFGHGPSPQRLVNEINAK